MLKEAHISKIEQKYAIPAKKAQELAEVGVLASVTAEDVRNLLGRDSLEGGGILIRYPGADEMFAIRLDIPHPRKDKPGKSQKYDRPAGLPPRLFVPPNLDLNTAEEIWITEGELKALAGWAHGLPVAALAGVWNWRQDVDESDPEAAAAKLAGPGGKTPDPEALIPDLVRDWAGKIVALIYDSDITQDHPAWPAFPRLAEQLYARGAAVVKVITLPAVEPLEGEGEDGTKTGLDDYLRRRMAWGFDAAAELRELMRRAPEWVPTGGHILGCIEKVGTLEGLEKYARARLGSGDPARMVLGAAAYYAAGRQTLLQAALKDLGIKGDMAQAVKRDAQAEAERIRERQAPRRASNREAEVKAAKERIIAEAFPPAAEVLPKDFPFPRPSDEEENLYFDIRDGKVVEVRVFKDEEGEEERVTVVAPTVILLAQHVDPVEREAGIEKWRVAWWVRNKWKFADVPARWLFDHRRVGELVDVGIPTSSASIQKLVRWLDALCCLATLGHQDAPELPTIRAVSRCGWHVLDGERFFVYGKEILRPGGAAGRADAGDREEIQPDAGAQTDADVRWAEDISMLERQILTSLRCGGDPDLHKKFLLDTAVKYPQVAFGLGIAAGVPLLRFARIRGLIEVDGFSVLMLPRGQGRSRHQGKSTWNAVVASLYGWPATGPEGRLRYADQTLVARAVLFATNCDMPVHLEDLQRLIDASKKGAGAELAHLFQQVSSGQDRDRGARGGGGRRTRGYYTVLFGTAEVDITAKLPPEAGAHDRILELPPLLPEDTPENARESERLLRMAMEHYGHAGREYLAWLVEKVCREGMDFIAEDVEAALEELRKDLPSDARRGTAWRLASRAATGLAGLAFMLEAWGVGESDIDACIDSFFRGWEMVLEGISEETVAGRALEAIADFAAVNQEAVENLRTVDPDHPRTPQKWVGAVTIVRDELGREVKVLALPYEIFAEAVSREPYNLDPAHAIQALVKEGYVVTRKVKQDNREKTLYKLQVRIANAKPYCVCIPLYHLGLDDKESGENENDLEETPF